MAGRYVAVALLGTILVVLVGVSSVLASAASTKASPIALQDEEVPQSEGENVIYTHRVVLIGYPTFTEVTVCLRRENVPVTIQIPAGPPAEAVEPPLLVNAYLSIEAGGPVDNVIIKFKVSKSWLEQNKVDENTIVLLRLNGSWAELPTRPVDSDNLYLYYEAISPGFSVFAVAGRSARVQAPLALYAMMSIVAAAGGFAVFYWLTKRPMRPFVRLVQLKRMIAGRKPKGVETGEAEMAAAIRRLRRTTKLKPAAEPSVEVIERPSELKKLKGAKKDIKLLKKLKRKMGREK